MPIPSFDELFDQREAYFKKEVIAQWETTRAQQESQRQTRGVSLDLRKTIKQQCEGSIPTKGDYQKSHHEAEYRLEDKVKNTVETNIKTLKDQGQLAFLWVYIYEVLNAKTDYQSTEFKYEEDQRDEAKKILSEIKATLLTEMQNAKTLKDLIAKRAFLCANLSGMALVSMLLAKADLRHSNLRQCEFNNTSLVDANLEEADLQGADLTEVLSSDKPSGLSSANLRGANLSDAKYKHTDIMAVDSDENPAGNLYRTNFGWKLPPSYAKNPAQKQELANKIRKSYEGVKNEDGNAKYNPTFLKLIQASGNSPLSWGRFSSNFDDEYQKWVDRSSDDDAAALLLTQMKKTLGEMVDPNHERGYEKKRSEDFVKKFFPQKASRPAQITELTDLIKDKDSNQIRQDLTIDQIADKLLKVSNEIRLEDNKLRSELLNQIENACKHPEVKGPKPE